MPLIDLRAHDDRDGEASPLTRCDVCIVGTGPAGATIASELATTPLRVTLLESGGFERLADADELNAIESVGRPRVDDQWKVRNRIVGGSSHTWGGRGAPFDEVDFEPRSWVPGSGWPFGLDALAPYLERSATHLGLALGNRFSDERFWEIAPQARYPTPPDPALIRPFYWQFSRDPDEAYPYEYRRFGRSLLARLGPAQTLVTGATALRIDPQPAGRAVRALVFADPGGRRHEIAAPVVVLCAGAIENARLLLASTTVTPAGLGNDRDLVGRYLMDHLRGTTGSFAIPGSRALQKRFGRYNVRGHLFRAGFRLSPHAQRAEGLLNCATWLGEILAPDDPWDGMRRFVRGDASRIRAVRDVVRNLDYVARGVIPYFVERNGVPRKLSALTLETMCEQRPDRDSRVTLSDRRDRFGARLPRIDWRVHPDEPRSIRRLAELAAQELRRMGLPAPALAGWVRDGAGLPPSFVDVAHPTGTTRMAADPQRGAVDTNGQVHGVDGLYVAGSSVFPTAGHCNPTHMIVALAIRTADAVRARMGG